MMRPASPVAIRLASGVLAISCVTFGACSDEQVVQPAQEPVTQIAPAAATIYIETGGAPPSPRAQRAIPPTSADHVHVYPGKDLGRPLEVVGVLDFHSSADSEDKGFVELKARAAALGADAVIGAEFEHGDPGEKSHLSGMAVRYIDQ